MVWRAGVTCQTHARSVHLWAQILLDRIHLSVPLTRPTRTLNV